MKKQDWPKTPAGMRKKDCGMLPTRVLEPIFLADPTHRVRSVARYFFSMADSPKSTCTKGDAMRMKRNTGCWLKQNRGKTFEQFQQSANSPLNHLFNDHSACSMEWCARKSGKPVEEGRYRCKQKDANLYEEMKKIWQRFTREEMLLEMHHRFDVQTNESLNQSMACHAPKTRTFSMSASLEHRMMVCVGEHNAGLFVFWSNVLHQLGLPMDGALHQYAVAMDNMKKRKKLYKERGATKRKRSEKYLQSIANQVKKDIKSQSKGIEYRTGMAMERDNNEPASDKHIKEKKQKKTNLLCRFCGRAGHCHRSSKQCGKHHHW